MKKKNSQMSSSLAVGILLALAGGFMDAYSYMARGHVFANAQTGNILLFAVAISEGRPADSLRYLLPVVSFALGIALAAAMRTRFGHMSRLHWRQLTLLVEILILFGVSFFPAGQHLGANSLTSLACGIQVQAFRKIEGNGIATTIYRIDRIQNYKTLDRHFAQRYTDRFQEGEMRKRIQFMYGGELQTIRFEYTGPSLESVLDRLPTAKVLQVTEKGWIVEAEVFGTGIQMWVRSQGDYIKIISEMKK